MVLCKLVQEVRAEQREMLLNSPPPNPNRIQPTDCWPCSDSSLDRAETGNRGSETEEAKPRRVQRNEAKRSGAERTEDETRRARPPASKRSRGESSETKRSEAERSETRTRREGRNPTQASETPSSEYGGVRAANNTVKTNSCVTLLPELFATTSPLTC